MQFTIEQLANSKQRLAFCQQHDVTPLLSYALLRHFSPNYTYNGPLISLPYSVLYALSAATPPVTVEQLFVAALKHMKHDLRSRVRHAPDVAYTRVESTKASYKARFKHNGERYVFHLLQREPNNWSMTLCYADDD